MFFGRSLQWEAKMHTQYYPITINESRWHYYPLRFREAAGVP